MVYENYPIDASLQQGLPHENVEDQGRRCLHVGIREQGVGHPRIVQQRVETVVLEAGAGPGPELLVVASEKVDEVQRVTPPERSPYGR